MYIEQVTEQRLAKASAFQLTVLRNRFIQTWNKYFHLSEREQLGSLSKRDFLSLYGLLIKEMAKRMILPKTASALDKFVFDSAMFKFSAASLGDVVVVPDYCSIAGSFVRNPKEAGDVDIVIRAPEDQRDETLELKLARTLAKVLEKDIELIYHPSGPHSSYIPLFDLVLRAKDKMEIVRVKEGKSVDVAKGLTAAQRKECDEETERIRENRKKAKWPHKFKPAKYTHPNGHPRCIICGQEERIGGICHKPKDLEKGIRPAFGSPAGKKVLAPRIVGYIPAHKTYIEPFVGGGAVFFAKEPSEEEVINDIDQGIITAYRFLQEASEETIEQLKKKTWTGSKALWERLKKTPPSTALERFYKKTEPLTPFERFCKWIYVRRFSYAAMGESFNERQAQERCALPERMPILKKRLDGVTITREDYRFTKKYDSPDSFYYLDPPYPGTANEALGGEIDMVELHEFCKGLKGKFILSLNDNSENRKLFKDFQIKTVTTSQQIETGGHMQESRTELLVSNFPLKKSGAFLVKEETEEEAGGEIDDEMEKGIRPAFGSSGGKKYLAKAIVSFIPEHKIYVEPFIGGGAVLFAKEVSEKEVINDKSPEIAFAYRFIKNMTEDDYKALKDMDWVIKKSLFDRLKNQKPSNPRERFRKFIYVRTASYGKLERNYDSYREGTDLAKTFLTRLPVIKERLKDVQVFNKDYKEMKAFDSRDSFFSFYYLDPPYPETETEPMGGEIDMSELYKFCSNLKGKFILSLNDNKKNRELFKEFNIKKVETSQQMDVGGSWQHRRPELLISNYPLKKVNIYLAKEECINKLYGETDEEIEKGIRGAFGSTGGKTNIAKEIIGFIPEHKSYIEPFAGGAAIFFGKEPSEVEVLNDLDPEIAFAYRFVQNVTEDDIKKLKNLNWIHTEYRWRQINEKKIKPKNDVERYYQFIYHIRGSFSNARRTIRRSSLGTSIMPDLDHLLKVKERLKGVEILNQDYKSVIRKYDSHDSLFTFFYLDPPYPEEWPGEGEFEVEPLAEVLKGIKGKFILSLDKSKKNKDLFKDYHIRDIKRITTWTRPDQQEDPHHRSYDTEILISNFPLKKTNLYLAKDEEGIHKEREDFRLTLVGTGAMDSPRKDESLLVSYKEYKVLIDAGEKIKAKDLPKLDAVLVCDDESRYMRDAKRIGEAFDLVPRVSEFHADGLEIIPFPVKHTSHKTYGYRIEAQGKTAIYAPEFYAFPLSEVENADVAILEGSAWNRPITFTGGVGGHAAVLDTWEKAKKAGIKRIIFTHIGKPVEENLEEAKEMGIEVGEDGQVIEMEEIEKAPLSPGRAFTPLKSRGGYGKYEFGDVDALWTAWAQGYIPEPGVAVETKIDGFRVQIHKWDENAKIFSEDAKRDLGPLLPELVEEIKSIKGSFILDGELTVYVDHKKVERKDMPTYLMAENPPPFKAKVDVFECVYRDGETLVNNPWTDRQEALDAIFADVDELLLNRLKPTIVKSKEAFLAAVKKHSGEKHSEGAMCKVINSRYSLDGETSEWAKFKNLKELRVKVVGKESKKGGGFIYTCELKGGISIGKTYSTKIEASAGDILEVAVAEVKYDEEEDRFTWDNPIVRSKKPAGTGLTTKEQAKAISKLKRTKLAKKDLEDWGFGEDEFEFLLEPFVCVAKDGQEFGNITFEVGDKGKGVAQVHIMGLSEEEIEKLKKETTRVMIARGSIEKLEAVLKRIIGDHGAHIDMRLRRGKENEWQGNEVFIGNISGLSKLSELKEGKRKLRAPWKQSRADEPKTEAITGPLGWMEAGARKIDVFAPGTPGATANKWGAMIRIDTFDWEMYLADEHAKKFRISDRFFDGNWLFAYVPITEAGKKGERIWMISKLKDSDYEETIRERTEKQWMNSPTFAYRAVYGTLPKESLRGRTDSPKKNWRGLEVDAHLKDEWLENLNGIEGIEIRATDEGKDSERVAFVVFRMENPDEDSKAEDISRDLNSKPDLYSSCDEGREGRPRIVVAGKVVYGGKGWESWWESLADKIAEAVGTFEKLDLERFRSEGIDEDLANPKKRYRQLIADLRYLGNSGYPKLKAGEKWGDWTLKDLLRYFAKIVDTLRSIYFPVLSPKIGEKGYNTSYWQSYREARQHMKSQPPGKNEVKEWDKKRKALIKKDRLEDLESTVKNGIYLVAPHGELIFKGEKKAVVKLRKLAALEDWSILVSGDYAYGFIRCRAPREIDLAEFKDLFPSHRVTDNERDSWWKGAKSFYYYQIRDFVPYKDKKAVEVPGGVQVSIKEVKFRKSILEKEEIQIPIFKVSEEEHIVGGIVYEPMKEDVQGDFATEQEIRDACYYFMEHSQRFKLQHKGQPITQKINILENYIVPREFEVNKQKVRKGSWVLIIRVLDAGIWKDIKEEKITGFSMAGLAHRRKVEKI